jgi:hypothetical protein
MKCPTDDCGAEMYPESRWTHWCPRCGTYVCDHASLSGVRVPAQAKRHAALREAAEAGAKACRAIDGAALASSDEERFGELVSESLGLIQEAITKLTAALAPDDGKE